jgi:hypothetical protein
MPKGLQQLGGHRICCKSSAEHSPNACNPKMTYPGLSHRWSDAD